MRRLNADIFTQPPRSPYVGYIEDSAQPLMALIFLSPVLLVYHLGVWLLSREELHLANGADLALAKMLNSFYFAGVWALREIAPAWAEPSGWAITFLRGGSSLATLSLLAAVLLLQQHLAGGRWRWRWRTLPLMLAESVVWALPLWLLEGLVKFLGAADASLTIATGERLSAPSVALIMAAGAGVYEEFLFRLLLMSLLFGIARALDLRRGNAVYMAVMLAQALVFAGFHYLPGMDAPFSAETFTFRALAGLYLGYLYLERGFALAAGGHVVYDVLITI
ncbi:hypothetical protein FACS1894139_04840 [Planctomycetales bacterium]|nr:hypothetical protein FACS1894107_03420 [Planctomycetales bacterium]GHS96984.1 hypothetical protein FACS1894108_02580 [Planctomycetales bacterium]GHT03774.1 hypothetical protein FACS1894139_04840 [Planctomycetales bacterium]GHV23755.1 hypothetical protein AGMMS49959_17880 [Planctomycetales bacterium]